ncbi:SDR family NAD(P)-dependent oxidoreductase [Dactylosporangium sp. NPDC005572]|uniref:SDR family NAD(P)-dependent oxidoreductase n=1 Tax=Dactylosporangium sp. NPDC005572 TaxID=3156889 RepID=UPI0033BAEF36
MSQHDSVCALVPKLAGWPRVINADGGGGAVAAPTDVRDEHQVGQLVDAAVATFGRVDIVVNNAGGTYLKPLDSLSLAEWNPVVLLNLSSDVHHDEGGGSPSGGNRRDDHQHLVLLRFHGAMGGAPYSAAKSGVEMVTEIAAAELSPRGIRVNSLPPG